MPTPDRVGLQYHIDLIGKTLAIEPNGKSLGKLDADRLGNHRAIRSPKGDPHNRIDNLHPPIELL